MQVGRETNAFVTGAANGIGRGISRALARAGARVFLADVEAEALADATREVESIRPGVASAVVDVTDPAGVASAARAAEAAFGPIHVLVNNAGVSAGRHTVAGLEPNQWDWLFGVNVHGVLNGVRAFLPGMLAHGKPGHIVNTASIGGFQVNPVLRNGSYAATKYAVVAISEALRLDLEETPIGVSVFCPALVHTTLDQSDRRRPARFGGPRGQAPVDGGAMVGNHSDGGLTAADLMPAITADEAGDRVVHGIGENELFLFTHPQTRAWLEQRHGRLMAGFDSLSRFGATMKTDAG